MDEQGVLVSSRIRDRVRESELDRVARSLRSVEEHPARAPESMARRTVGRLAAWAGGRLARMVPGSVVPGRPR
jgi:hypothetical protein